MPHRTDQKAKNQDQPQIITQLFSDFAKNLQIDAKHFNDEYQKTKERIENGTRITKHRITL